MKSIKAWLLTTMMVVYWVSPYVTYSCGPYFKAAIFSSVHTPDFPLDQFLRGKLGVVHPGLEVPYLFVAYRYLAQEPLSSPEQNEVSGFIHQLPDYNSADTPTPSVERWKRARALVTSAKVEISRFKQTNNYFQSFENCQTDAFENAAQTLQSRAQQFGAQSRVMRGWVAAQDTVFDDCEKGKKEPDPAREDDPALIKADRAYQTAASHFYSGQLEDSEKEFHAIAVDKQSPWSGLANYLEARAIVRRASFAFDDETPKIDSDELERAEKILQAILQREDLQRWHHAARERIGMIEARIHPDERAAHLAEVLSKPHRTEFLQQEVRDFFWLLRRGHVARDNEMTDWIATMRDMEGASPNAQKHAIERWMETKSAAWMVAAMCAEPQESSDALLREALNIEPMSPAYLTAANYRIRRGPQNPQFVDNTLQASAQELPPSARNRILHEKLLHAQSLDEFLSAAARVPADIDWDFGDIEGQDGAKKAQTPLFDQDATTALNRKLPLKMLMQAAESGRLPKNLRKEVTKVAWTKAFLLQNDSALLALTPGMEQNFPEMKPYLQRYVSETDVDKKQFAIVDAMLHFPGVTPLAQMGVLRETPMNKIDNFSNNWWCSSGGMDVKSLERANGIQTMSELGWSYYAADKEDDDAQASFLSAEDKALAAAEWKKLIATPPGKTFLANRVLDFQKKHTDDERVPQDLDLSLRALRYGCSLGEPGLAHKVFRLLHAKYPGSTAAKRNRPWGDW